ncbi:MAG: DNA polymerase domain-containing protein [Candidatus Aenigmatarchaeota archaeon]
MEVTFQVLDCDYIPLNNKPVLRVFGKTKEGKTVCAFYDKFLPYFYVLPKKNCEEEFVEFMKKTFSSLLVEIREEEKFLPIGFTKNKTKMLRVTVNDPSKVPEIREELNKKNFIEKIFEADILFKYRFMADFNISGMGWIKVEGESANTILVKADKIINASKFEEVEEKTNVSFKYLSLDIEVAPGKEGIPNPVKDPIIIISLSFFPAYENNNTLVLVSKPIKRFEKDVLVFSNESEMLQEFIEIVKNFDPDIIVGYNINNFDLPYILERLRVNKIPRLLGRCQQKSTNSKKVGIRYRHSSFGRIVVDVYELVKEAVEKGLLRLKRYGLGDVAKELLKEEKIDITHSEISKYWNGSEEQKHELINYARKDAELTLKLLLEKDMLSKFIELSKVSGLLLQDVLDSRESARVENLLLREFNKRGFVIPTKPSSEEVFKRMEEREAKGLKGALVLEPKVGLHTNCVAYLDFACHPSDTEVVVKGKGKTKICDVKEGDYVLGKNGWHRVKKVWVYDYDGYLININGLKCTPNHKLPVLKGNKVERCVKDKLAISIAKNKVKGKIIRCVEIDRIAEMEKNSLAKDYLLKSELLGIILAEGCFQRRDASYYDKGRKKRRVSHQYRVEITISKDEEELKNRIVYIFKELWGIEPYEIRSKNSKGLTLATARKEVYKEIESMLKNVENYDSRGILRGFFEGDGSVNVVRRSLVLTQSFKNKWKLELASNFLNKLGIAHNLYTYKKGKIERVILEIPDRESIVKFSVMVGSISSKKREQIEHILERKSFSNAINNKFYSSEEIQFSVERYKGKVYDLTLNSEPYYFANSILTHNSMYPSIFISFNICPTTLVINEKEGETIRTPSGALFVKREVREGIIPKILKFLIEERDRVKKEMEKVRNENERKVLDSKQYALKIMANAFYGYTGYVRARLYVLEIANAITSCGRFLIEKTKKIVETKKGYEVVYGDTDSIMVKLPTLDLEEALKLGEELSDFINKEHEGIVKMKIEGIFKTLLVLTKKRYAGWNFEKSNGEWKDKIVMKGIETVRRDWCDLVSKTLYKVIDIILKEQNPKKALKYVREVLGKLNRNEIPIEELVITRGITKSLKEYKGIQPHIELVKKLRKRSPAGAPGIGDRIGYVIIQGTQMLSERAEDPEYVKAHNLKIDSRYYIESQVLPPLERVFDALGIKKSELISFGRLLSISEAFNHKKQEEVLNDFEGFVCNKCNKTFRRIPLIGKCSVCGGEVLFYFGEARGRYVKL